MDLSSIMSAACASLVVSSYHPACDSALHATAAQSGLAGNIQKLSDYASHEGDKAYHKYIAPVVGEPTVALVALSYKTYREKQVSYHFRVQNYIDSVQLGANVNSINLSVGWRF